MNTIQETDPPKPSLTVGQSDNSIKPVALAKKAFQGCQILVIDDVRENRLIIMDLLESVGFKVMLAKNGIEGIEVACRTKPHGILTDIFMGVKPGWLMVKELRQMPAFVQTPIIAVTASHSDVLEKKMKDAGCDDFLHQPIDENKLLALLKKYFY